MGKYRVVHTESGHIYKGGLKTLQEAKAYINRNRETLKKYLPKKCKAGKFRAELEV